MKATIDRIKWIDGEGSIRAYLDILFDGMMVSKNWKIMDSEKGRWLAPPAHKGKDEKWYPDITFKTREIGDDFAEHIIALADRDRNGGGEQRPSGFTDDGHHTGLEDQQHQEKTPPAGSEPLKPQIDACKACGAKIVWFKTKAGKSMPVDAGTVPVGATEYDPVIMEVHWATCPNADQFRK